jgi:ABC-type multidrug transport system permease subunit
MFELPLASVVVTVQFISYVSCLQVFYTRQVMASRRFKAPLVMFAFVGGAIE